MTVSVCLSVCVVGHCIVRQRYHTSKTFLKKKIMLYWQPASCKGTVQYITGTVQLARWRHSGTLERWLHAGTLAALWHVDTLAGGTLARWNAGRTLSRWWHAGTLTCTLARTHASIQVHWHTDTLARWHAGTLARLHAGTLTRTLSQRCFEFPRVASGKRQAVTLLQVAASGKWQAASGKRCFK